MMTSACVHRETVRGGGRMTDRTAMVISTTRIPVEISGQFDGCWLSDGLLTADVALKQKIAMIGINGKRKANNKTSLINVARSRLDGKFHKHSVVRG